MFPGTEAIYHLKKLNMILHLYSLLQTEESLFDFYEAEPPYNKKWWCKDRDQLRTRFDNVKIEKLKKGRLKPKCRCEFYGYKHELKKTFGIKYAFHSNIMAPRGMMVKDLNWKDMRD